MPLKTAAQQVNTLGNFKLSQPQLMRLETGGPNPAPVLTTRGRFTEDSLFLTARANTRADTGTWTGSLSDTHIQLLKSSYLYFFDPAYQ